MEVVDVGGREASRAGSADGRGRAGAADTTGFVNGAVVAGREVTRGAEPRGFDGDGACGALPGGGFADDAGGAVVAGREVTRGAEPGGFDGDDARGGLPGGGFATWDSALAFARAFTTSLSASRLGFASEGSGFLRVSRPAASAASDDPCFDFAARAMRSSLSWFAFKQTALPRSTEKGCAHSTTAQGLRRP